MNNDNSHRTPRTCGHPGFIEDGRCEMGHGASPDYSQGDAVQHRTTGEVAVVIEQLGRNRILVARGNGTDAVWYIANVEVV